MKKLKIGIITHNFPSSETDRQNAGVFVYDLARVLNKKTDIVVFSPGEKDEIRSVGGIKTHFFKFSEKLGNLKVYNLLHLLKFANFFVNGKKAFKIFINKNPDLDFMISMWAFPGGYFSYNAFLKKNIPYAIYCLGSDIYIYAKKPLLKNLIRKYLLNAKIRIADSPHLAEEVKKISSETIFLPSSSNLVNIKFDKKPSKKIVLTFLGRLEKVKGVDIFLDALKMLQGSLQNVQVNIVGSGSYEKIIKKKARELPKIKLWGNLNDQKKISSILADSNWLVVPSRSDSIPLVFSEAMKLSLPVIVSDLPDLRYLLNKYQVGFLFKNGSVSALAKVLKKVLTGETAYQNFRANTAKAAEIFDLNKTSDRLLTLINQSL